MNTKSFQPRPNYTTQPARFATSQSIDVLLAPLTVDDITGDIERIISRTVGPFIDPTSYALNTEDLKAECRAKLARIISEGRLAKCPTRAKAFAFVKTSLRNHVRSLVQKHAYAMKRTGRAPRLLTLDDLAPKPIHIRIDDPEMAFQLGAEDQGARAWEILEELSCRLSASEMVMLNDLISKRAESSDCLTLPREDWRSGPENVRQARKRLLQRCKAILAGCD